MRETPIEVVDFNTKVTATQPADDARVATASHARINQFLIAHGSLMIRPSIDARDTVSDVVRAYPHTAVVFKTFGIDTYWDGAASLDFAARRHNVDIDALLAALHSVAGQPPENPTGAK